MTTVSIQDYYVHTCTQNQLPPKYQQNHGMGAKWLKRKSRGSKELLVIDNVVTKQAKKKAKKLKSFLTP